MRWWAGLTGAVLGALVAGTVVPGTVPGARADTLAQGVAPVVSDVAHLSRTLRMAEVMAILREEGVASGVKLAQDQQPGPADPLWLSALERIHDPARMEALFNAGFDRALAGDPQTVAEATAFFGSDLGQRVLGLEIAARRAMMDEAVEAAAGVTYDRLARDNPGRQALLDRFVAANDLIEFNVTGAMNANLAFLRGLAEVGDAGFALSEADMLAQVRAAEPDTRAAMVAWLFPFLALAYQPLSDAELRAYVAFCETSAGRQINAAMFRAFDGVFDQISRELGRAFARSLTGDNI